MTKLVFIIATALCFWGCNTHDKHAAFYVNSYHRGYPSSDETEAGIKETLDTSRITLTTFYLDGKRSSKEDVSAQAQAIRQKIKTAEPDVVIVSDDLALQEIILPDLDNTNYAVVFCGVNWSARDYNLPSDRATGMVEVLPVKQCATVLGELTPPVSSITILSEKTEAEEKNKAALVSLFENLGLRPDYKMVSNFSEWKTEFLNAQQDGNAIFLPTNGAIANWSHEEAVSFVMEHAKVPLFTCDDFMMPYVAFGFTKVAREQGRYAAAVTEKILNGTPVAQIPTIENKEQNCFINDALVAKLQIKTSHPLLKDCKKIR